MMLMKVVTSLDRCKFIQLRFYSPRSSLDPVDPSSEKGFKTGSGSGKTTLLSRSSAGSGQKEALLEKTIHSCTELYWTKKLYWRRQFIVVLLYGKLEALSLWAKRKTTPLKHSGEKGYDTRNFGVFPIEKGKESLDFWDFNFPHNRKSPRIYASHTAVKLETTPSHFNIERNIKTLIQIRYWGVESQLYELGSKPLFWSCSSCIFVLFFCFGRRET